VKKKDMNTRIKILALILIVIAALVAGSIVLALQSTAKANPTSSVASDAQQPALSSVNETNNSGPFIIGHMGFGNFAGMGRGCRGIGGPGGFGGFGAIQVSSDFTQNVTSIAKNDSDVQNLISQGFNITSVRPLFTTTIDGNGNVVTKATGANLTLQSTTGRSLVVVDLNQAKVTKIMTSSMTEIDK
jgi:hypothetical protein